MTVTVDDGCISCGLCAQTAPEIFRMGEDGTAQATWEELPAQLQPAAKQAAEECPTSVIRLE